MQSIVIHPELGRLAAKNGFTLAFYIWTILRQTAINEQLSTHYSKTDAKSILKSLGLAYTDRQFRNVFAQGNGVFWGIGANHYHLRSFERVTGYFARNLADSDRTFITPDLMVTVRLHKSHAAQNSEIYYAWFIVHGERVISRDTLHDLFGFSHDQQRHYEKLLGVRLKVAYNYAHINLKEYSKNPQELPKHHFTIDYEREIRFDEDIETVTAIQYQLPNSFLARPESSGESPSILASNAVRKAARTLIRHTLAESPQKRLYWLKWKDFEYAGATTDYIRAFFQGRKRLFLSGNYL